MRYPLYRRPMVLVILQPISLRFGVVVRRGRMIRRPEFYTGLFAGRCLSTSSGCVLYSIYRVFPKSNSKIELKKNIFNITVYNTFELRFSHTSTHCKFPGVEYGTVELHKNATPNNKIIEITFRTNSVLHIFICMYVFWTAKVCAKRSRIAMTYVRFISKTKTAAYALKIEIGHGPLARCRHKTVSFQQSAFAIVWL